MTTLPDKRIIEYGERIVTPFDQSRVQPASYDLSLGEKFIRFSAQSWHMIDLADMKDESPRAMAVTDQFVIEPGEFVLGETAEVVSVLDNMVGRLEGKSTIGRVGLLIHVTAGFVDPGWSGKLTLEIYNVRRVPIILRPGLPFCQMSWAYMEPPDHAYAGRYQGAEGVESSKPWEASRREFAKGGYVGGSGDDRVAIQVDPGRVLLSPNHPARGLLPQEDMDESGYDGPAASPCCGALLDTDVRGPQFGTQRAVVICSQCKQEVRI